MSVFFFLMNTIFEILVDEQGRRREWEIPVVVSRLDTTDLRGIAGVPSVRLGWEILEVIWNWLIEAILRSTELGRNNLAKTITPSFFCPGFLKDANDPVHGTAQFSIFCKHFHSGLVCVVWWGLVLGRDDGTTADTVGSFLFSNRSLRLFLSRFCGKQTNK